MARSTIACASAGVTAGVEVVISSRYLERATNYLERGTKKPSVLSGMWWKMP